MGVTLSDPQPAEQGELFPVDDVKQPIREPQSKVVNKVTEKDKQEVTVP